MKVMEAAKQIIGVPVNVTLGERDIEVYPLETEEFFKALTLMPDLEISDKLQADLDAYRKLSEEDRKIAPVPHVPSTKPEKVQTLRHEKYVIECVLRRGGHLDLIERMNDDVRYFNYLNDRIYLVVWELCRAPPELIKKKPSA